MLFFSIEKPSNEKKSLSANMHLSNELLSLPLIICYLYPEIVLKESTLSLKSII